MSRESFPINGAETLHMRDVTEQPGVTCDVHGWPTAGMAPRLFGELRQRKQRGDAGLNVCRECIGRARADAALAAAKGA